MKSLIQLFNEGNLSTKGIERKAYSNPLLQEKDVKSFQRFIFLKMRQVIKKEANLESFKIFYNLYSTQNWLDNMVNSFWANHYIKENVDTDNMVENIKKQSYNYGCLLDNKIYNWLKIVERNVDKKYSENINILIESYKVEVGNESYKEVDLLTKYESELRNVREKECVIFKSDSKLLGVDANDRKTYKDNGENLDKDGMVIILNNDSYDTLLTSLQLSDERKHLFDQAYNIGAAEKVFDDLIKLRVENAGKEISYAHSFLNNNLMTPESLSVWLKKELKNLKPEYNALMNDMKELAKKDGLEKLNIWDLNYYSKKINNYGNFHNINGFNFYKVMKLIEKNIESSFNVKIKGERKYQLFGSKQNYYKWTVTDITTNRESVCYFAGVEDINYCIPLTYSINDIRENSLVSIISFNVKNQINFDGLLTLFHEVGHFLNYYLAKNVFKNIYEGSHEVLEVPSTLLETTTFYFENIKELKFKNKVLEKSLFEKMKNSYIGTNKNVFIYYQRLTKYLVLNELAQKAEGFTYKELIAELHKNNVFELVSDSLRMLDKDYYAIYSLNEWIYDYGEFVVQKILQKASKSTKIENVNLLRHLVCNVLTRDEKTEYEKLKEEEYI